jgi:thiamine thiazole synthase
MRKEHTLPLNDVDISRVITKTYFDRLLAAHESDVLIVGAGPAGLTAAGILAGQGRRVTILERKVAPGGGI